MFKNALTKKIKQKLILKYENLNIRLLSIYDNFFIRDNYTSKTFSSIIIKYLIYGEKHIDVFLTISLPSILQEGNIPKIIKSGIGVEILIFTKNDYEKKLIKEHKNFKYVNSICSTEFVTLDENNTMSEDDLKYISTRQAFKKSRKSNTPIFMASPEDFYGNKSLYNLVFLLGSDKDFLISTHARVNWIEVYKLISEKYDSNPNTVIQNDELVKIAIQNLTIHVNTLLGSDELSNTAGLSIEKLSNKEYLVNCSRPNPHFGGIKISDETFLKKYMHLNYTDFLWPRKLIKEMRLKFVGTSDIFFKVELTEDFFYNHTYITIEEKLKNKYAGRSRMLNHKYSELHHMYWRSK